MREEGGESRMPSSGGTFLSPHGVLYEGLEGISLYRLHFWLLSTTIVTFKEIFDGLFIDRDDILLD